MFEKPTNVGQFYFVERDHISAFWSRFKRSHMSFLSTHEFTLKSLFQKSDLFKNVFRYEPLIWPKTGPFKKAFRCEFLIWPKIGLFKRLLAMNCWNDISVFSCENWNWLKIAIISRKIMLDTPLKSRDIIFYGKNNFVNTCWPHDP